VIYGIYLSVLLWRLRSVFIESRKVIFCFYNLALFAIIWVVLQNTLTDPALLYVFRSACIFISVFSTTVFLFVPRMLSPNKTSSGLSGSSNPSTTSTEPAVLPAGTSGANIEFLQKKIAELQEEIDQLKHPVDSSQTEPEDDEEKKKKTRAGTLVGGQPPGSPAQTVPLGEESSKTES